MTSLIARAPEEAVRILALTQLAKAEQAAARLSDPDDPEALHDFRVAIRRLRTVLAAYPQALKGALRKAHSKRLRALAHGTGSGRDAEVALDWVRSQRGSIAPARHDGIEYLASRLERSKAQGYAKVYRRLRDEFEPLSLELQRRLGSYTREVRLGSGPGDTFGYLAAGKLESELARLESLLTAVGSVDDIEPCHNARLSAKRLRYLLEPLARELDEAVVAVDRLKSLQDLLGELNDAHVLVDQLGGTVERVARKRVRELFAEAVGKTEARGDEPPWAPVDGVLAVTKLNRERRDRLFAELESDWVGASAEASAEAASGSAARPSSAPPPHQGAARRELALRIGELVRTLREEDDPASEEAAEDGSAEAAEDAAVDTAPASRAVGGEELAASGGDSAAGESSIDDPSVAG